MAKFEIPQSKAQVNKGQVTNIASLTLNHKGEAYSMPVYGEFSVNSFVDFLGLDMSDVNDIATYISPLESIVIQQNYRSMRFSSQKYHKVSFRSPINDLITVTIDGAIEYPGKYVLEANTTLEDLYKLVGSFKSEAFMFTL